MTKLTVRYPKPGDPDEDVYRWPMSRVDQLFVASHAQPAWVKAFSYEEYTRKRYAGLLRINERLLEAEVPDYGHVRDVARERVLLAARLDAKEALFLPVLSILNFVFRTFAILVAGGLGPAILFGYSLSWTLFLHDSAFAVCAITGLVLITRTRRFGTHYMLLRHGISVRKSTWRGIEALGVGCVLTIYRYLAEKPDTFVHDVLLRELFAVISAAAYACAATIAFINDSLYQARTPPAETRSETVSSCGPPPIGRHRGRHAP